MDAELKQKWVDALRSGKYSQYMGEIRSTNFNNKFCCLGVLCDVNGAEWDRNLTFYTSIKGYESAYKYLHSILDRDIISKLIEKNDRYGDSFDKIADWVEKNL